MSKVLGVQDTMISRGTTERVGIAALAEYIAENNPELFAKQDTDLESAPSSPSDTFAPS